jgi:hypothetical protein
VTLRVELTPSVSASGLKELAFRPTTGIVNSAAASNVRNFRISAHSHRLIDASVLSHRGASLAPRSPVFCQQLDTIGDNFLLCEKCLVPDIRVATPLLQMTVVIALRTEVVDMSVSEDVLRLVRTVERLPSEDQDKILRMVDLLTLVPVPVQNKTQRMLRELLERQPDTKGECVAGVDDVLAYLERNAEATPRARDVIARLDFAAVGKVRPS